MCSRAERWQGHFSCDCANSKGRGFFSNIKEQLCVKEVSYEAGVKCNPSEYKSFAKPVERNTFFGDMITMSFEALARKYASPIKLSLVARIKRKIKGILIKVLRGKTLTI